jgi:hypothetical protein
MDGPEPLHRGANSFAASLSWKFTHLETGACDDVYQGELGDKRPKIAVAAEISKSSILIPGAAEAAGDVSGGRIEWAKVLSNV